MKDLSREYWSEFVNFDPLTGVLSWKEREVTSKYIAGWNKKFAGKTAGRLQLGYISIRLNGSQHLAHRIVWLFVTGEMPKGHIDHINGCRSDNRPENLRDVDPAVNALNRAINRHNKAGVSGVHYSTRDKVWVAEIHLRRKHSYLGSFKSKEEAVRVRKAAEAELGFHPNHGRPLQYRT